MKVQELISKVKTEVSADSSRKTPLNANDFHKAAVYDRVKQSAHLSWGGDDSAFVLEVLITVVGEGDISADETTPLAVQHVNASAFRQKLEKLDASHPAFVKKSETERKRGSGAAGI